MPFTFEMWHGTSKQAAENIVKNGFSASENGYLGRGVYGGYEDKARDFAKLGARHGGSEGALIKCRVTVDEGQASIVTANGDASRQRCKESNAPAVWYPGPPNGNVRRPEVCVRNPANIEVLSVERVECDSDDE
jgi:hypothetical protein